MKKALMAFGLVAMTAALSVNAEEVAWGEKNKDNMMMDSDCSKMNSKEQNFSSMLNDKNRKMFCGKFSSDQRRKSMDYSSNMSADSAVSKVMQENKMMYP